MGSQPSNGLNFNRQKVVKKVIFHLQPAKMQIDINRQKFPNILNLYSWLLKNLSTGKTSSHVFNNTFLDIKRPPKLGKTQRLIAELLARASGAA